MIVKSQTDIEHIAKLIFEKPFRQKSGGGPHKKSPAANQYDWPQGTLKGYLILLI